MHKSNVLACLQLSLQKNKKHLAENQNVSNFVKNQKDTFLRFDKFKDLLFLWYINCCETFMEVKLETRGDQGVLYIEENGMRIAFMRLIFRNNNKMVIDETEVLPGFEGQGLGKVLVNAAVDLARENGLRIFSVCPYAKSVLAKSDKYDDVLV